MLLVTLAAGVALGVTYERRRAPTPAYTWIDSQHLMQRFGRDLGLDESQRQAINTILSRRQLGVDARWREMQPHVRATLDSTFQEVLSVLTPVQAVKFRAMVESAHSAGNPHSDTNLEAGPRSH